MSLSGRGWRLGVDLGEHFPFRPLTLQFLKSESWMDFTGHRFPSIIELIIMQLRTDPGTWWLGGEVTQPPSHD